MFIGDILIEDELFGDSHSCQHNRSTLNQNVNEFFLSNYNRPFFSHLNAIYKCTVFSRQKTVSCDWQRKGRN